MGILKLFEGTGDLYCAIATIKTPEGSLQKVVDGAAFSVGRAPDCVLSIPEVGISRLHMLVTIKRGEIYITDQGSSNGTFLNGQKIESKRLIRVAPTDEIKLGKSEVIMQLGCIEKHFKTDYIAESLLPNEEKDNLMGLIKASHHKAQEIVGMAQSQADQLVNLSTEKARNIENQTLLMQEDILSKAQVESQQIISDTKRKSAQMIFEAEEKAREATHNIHKEAEQKRHQADDYYKIRTQEAQKKADEIIAEHTRMGQELIEDLHRTTVEKAENEAKEKLTDLFKLIDEKAQELDALQADCEDYQKNKKSELDKEIAAERDEFYKKFDFEKQTTLDDHHNQVAMLEAEFLHKKKELEEDESKRVQDIEKRIRGLTERLESEHADKRARLEREYADRTVSIEKDFATKQNRLENDFQSRQRELAESYDKNREEMESLLNKQRENLEREVELQRQNLLRVQSELEQYSSDHLELKSKVADLQKAVDGLEKSEQEVIKAIQDRRQELQSIESEHARVSEDIQHRDQELKSLQQSYSDLKNKFEQEAIRLQDEQDLEVKRLKEQIQDLHRHLESEKKRIKSETDLEVQQSRAEAARRTQDIMEQEKAKLEEYRSKVLQEKKQLDINFEKTKKEFETQTREMMEVEKQKLEDHKRDFLSLLNQQRNVVINEITKAIFKVSKSSGADFSGEMIDEAVGGVFDSHVAEFSLTTHTNKTVESSRALKAKWLGYGVAATLSFVLTFVFLIQPQINRNVAGTEENAKAVAEAMIRPKFERDLSLELHVGYLDSVLKTQRYAEIFTDPELQKKWTDFAISYMYETWRVPEEKTINVVAISRTLVTSLEQEAAEMDAQFAKAKIEKLKEVESEAIKRMADALGTEVKYQAFKRKEKEFFEQYILNQ